MENQTYTIQRSQKTRILTIAIFCLFIIWWVYTYFIENNNSNLVWAAAYQAVAVLGIVIGIITSSRWGGFGSLLGRSVLFFSLGLAFQVFGQSTFSYYNLVLKVNIPYPSIADIGYFGSIPLYIYATGLLFKVSGGFVALRSAVNKILAIILPLVMLFFSYWFFLKTYDFTTSQPLNIFLDFGYPLGQAVYVSIAILTYVLSKKYLGGLMKNSVLILLLALVTQYIADYNFLYQAYNGTWVNGGYGDILYLVSYFILTLGLLSFGEVYRKIRAS